MGNNSDPITLHKYLYANVDPANNIDPTGNFSIGSLGTAMNVLGRLTTIATTTYDLFKAATSEEEITAKKLGMLILMNYGGKYARNLLPKKVRDCLFNSFPSGTLVHTKSGLRKIEDIEIGQLVLSFNENIGENEYQPVTHLIQSEDVHHLVSVVLESGEVFEATHEHPFYVNGIWVPAEKLKQGSEISFLGGVSKIASVATYTKRSKVFNLSVDKIHTFYVGEKGVLVHNQNITCIPFKLKVKGKLPRNTPRFPAAPDWAVKGPHFTISTNKGPVELFFKVDATGRPVYTHVLGGGTASAVKAAMKEADELFRNKAFRAHVANKAYNGWEISMQTSKGIKNPKSDVIFETVTNLMKGL